MSDEAGDAGALVENGILQHAVGDLTAGCDGDIWSDHGAFHNSGGIDINRRDDDDAFAFGGFGGIVIALVKEEAVRGDHSP